ncbi:MAG: HAD family hydrolase [archaeon]
MKKEEKIKAIVLDVGGVLQLPRYSVFRITGGDTGVYEYIAKTLRIDMDSLFDTMDSAYAKSMEGELEDVVAVNLVAKNLGLVSRSLKKLFTKAYKRGFKRNNYLYKELKRLRKKGYIIAMLSDQWALSNEILIPKKDRKNFDVLVISNEVGLRKPNIRVYRLLIRKLREKKKNIKHSEVLFIENRNWNLKPARKLKMKTILFENNKQCIKEMEKLGVK